MRVVRVFQQSHVELDGNAGTAGNLVVARPASQQIAVWRILLLLYRIHSVALQYQQTSNRMDVFLLRIKTRFVDCFKSLFFATNKSIRAGKNATEVIFWNSRV